MESRYESLELRRVKRRGEGCLLELFSWITMSGKQETKSSGTVDRNVASGQRSKHHVPSRDYSDESKTVLSGSQNRRTEMLRCELSVKTRRHMLDHFGRPTHPLVLRTLELFKLRDATGGISLKG